jgi:hypothetical protein
MTTGEGSGWGGLPVRILAALVLVHATYNPEGFSFYHWAIEPLVSGTRTAGPAAIKFLVGVVLLAGWVVFLQATRRSIGIAGSALVIALAAGVIWLLLTWNVFTARSARSVQHIVLVILSLVLAVGMSWSHINRRMSGQLDTDEVA